MIQRMIALMAVVFVICACSLSAGDQPAARPPLTPGAGVAAPYTPDAPLLQAPTASQPAAEVSLQPPTLNRVASHELPQGTHRPEILSLPDGGLMLVVVEPSGEHGVGQVKHRAYRFDSQFNPLGEAFDVTAITAEYGEPADHRAAIVNGELVVIYQNLIWNENLPAQPGGAMEAYAESQSLLMARFSLDGKELFRGPIVAHATDYAQENFPDHCLLWNGERLLVSTGGQIKLREVDLNANILAAHALPKGPEGVPGDIGNSLMLMDGRLVLFSSLPPGKDAALWAGVLDSAYRIEYSQTYYDDTLEKTFPTGNLYHNGILYLGYAGRPRGGDIALESNPYDARLKLLDSNLNELADMQLGEDGSGHVHVTLAISGGRLFAAWSRQSSSSMGMGGVTPQVMVEEFSITP